MACSEGNVSYRGLVTEMRLSEAKFWPLETDLKILSFFGGEGYLGQTFINENEYKGRITVLWE